MALRLQALYDEVMLPLSDQPTVLGRSRQLRVTSTSVSRHACSCFQDGEVAAKVVAAKRIYIKRKNADDAFTVNKDENHQVTRWCQVLKTYAHTRSADWELFTHVLARLDRARRHCISC